MKRLLFILLIFIVSISSDAQTTEHLKFMSEPLTGSLDDFVTKFQERHPQMVPYEVDEENDSVYSFKGNFYKFYNCLIEISTYNRQQYNQVASAKVTIYNFLFHKNDVFTLVDDLCQKYGKCEIVEKIADSLYKIRWTCDSGIIELTTLTTVNTCTLEYIDFMKAVNILKTEIPKMKKESDDL